MVCAENFINLVNGALTQIASILFIESRNKTIKWCIGLYILGVIANWFSFPTLLTMVVIFSFSLPKIYDLFHPYIHGYMNLVNRQIDANLTR